MTNIQDLAAKIDAQEAASVADGTCHWYEIELCFPEVGCNKYFRRACMNRADAIKRGRAIARACFVSPAAIRARRIA